MTDHFFLVFAGTQTRILRAANAAEARHKVIEEYARTRGIRLNVTEVRARRLRPQDKAWLSDQLPDGPARDRILSSI